MKFNKIILIGLLLLAIVSFGAVSAADDVNSTDLTADVSDNLQMSSIDEDLQVNNGLKGESTTIVITNDTFCNYFDSEGKILDSVAEGATLDFQGQITSSDNIGAIYINKSVNIISSTKDATITLNTKNGQLGKENIVGRFIVEGASDLNINDLTFNRTQVLIYDLANVNLNNVKFISDNYRIVPKLHDKYDQIPLINISNVNNFTLKNGQVYVYDFGSIVLECNNVKEVLFDNNTFQGYAGKTDITNGSGKGRSFEYMIYLPEQDASVTMSNNKFYGNSTFVRFARVYASNILFENNYEEHPSPYVSTSKIDLGSDNSRITVKNNYLLDLSLDGNATVYNNIIKSHFGANTVLAYNNTFGSNVEEYCAVSIGSNSDFNNNVSGGIVIRGSNIILKDINMYFLNTDNGAKNITVKNCYIAMSDEIMSNLINIQSTETYIINNTIKGGITIKQAAIDPNCEIYDNVIGGNIIFEKYSSGQIHDNVIGGSISIKESAKGEILNNVINGPISIETSGFLVEDNVIKAFGSDYAVYIKSGKNFIYNEVLYNKLYSKWYCGDSAVSYDESYLNFVEDNTPVNQIGMSVNNAADVFDYGGNTTITVSMPNVEGNVTIDTGCEKFVVDLVNGVASQVLSKYSLGIHYVTVIYYDDVDDVWAIGHANFTVNKVAYCPVELVCGKVSEGNPSNINFILPEDADGNISVSLEYGIYTIDIEQVAKGRDNMITLPGLIEGDYTITAIFTSVKYVTNSSTGNISFVHIPVYELTVNDIVMDYNDGSKYKVLVTKDGNAVGAGETVKITFNGKTSNVKTDNDGYATLTLDASPKTYTIKAVYNGVTKSSKVTIKNILKASNISKKKAKTIKFSATLKSSKGKAIAGKKITFKIKGKTYTAKTNKKGVATISIKNLKVGKYTITSKYGVCSVKNTITIKK